MKILFVCSDNTALSPMAEALMKAACREMKDLTVQSAGLMAAPGMPAARKAIHAMMLQYQMDLSTHRTRRFDGELAVEADLILCMSGAQAQQIRALYPEAREKTSVFLAYARGLNGVHYDPAYILQLPKGQNLDQYLVCAYQIEQAVQKIKIRLYLKQRKESTL